jgi:acyl-CoA reductase-like NAD-dependent aldehyde dehydrogenase
MTAPGTLNPATLVSIGLPPLTAPRDVPAAVAAARAAQVAWAETPLARRETACLALATRILERRDEVAELLRLETGRDPAESLFDEIVFVLSYVKGACAVARKELAPERVPLSAIDFPGKRAMVEAVPRGVIAVIEPWNYPLLQFYKPLFPALLSGNAVVLKPSEHTPRVASWLKDQCDAVLPKDLVAIVHGDGAVGGALVEGAVDAVVFCGSVRTGRKVAARCAERLIPCSLELGGKDAAIVLADCALERTLAGILQWSLNNAGQDCSSIERLYVEESLADTFVARLGAAFDRLRVAPVAEGHADLGPLQNPMQLAVVEAHVADALAKGATLVCGGRREGPGLGYRPTILDRCDESMDVVRDETFGPVLAVIRVKDADEAVRRANDSRYGLNGSVWTADTAKGERLARRLDVGVALVNNHSFPGVVPQVPWTGTKETGTGVAASRHAYPTFVRRRTVLVDTSRDPDPFWRPVDAELAAFGDTAARFALGSWTAVFSLLGLLRRRVAAVKQLVAARP